MKRTLILILLIVMASAVWSQDQLSMKEVVLLARKQSLDAFRDKNMFLADYWEYQSYKSGKLPHLNWFINPVSYNRRMTMRYDSENNIDVYREQQTLSSYSVLSLKQNIIATGGTLSLESDLYRLQNFNNSGVNSWSSTPFRIGLSQPLWGFNPFKWEKLISPLKYEKAKQEYIRSVQQTNKKAVQLYFDLLLANMQKEIAAQNVATADTLYKVGMKRFGIASIQQEELLDLELSKFNSQIEQAQAEKNYEKARFNLISFLGENNTQEIVPIMPDTLDNLFIDETQAFEIARRLNPEILQLRQKELEAARSLEQAVKDSRFNANLDMSYGLNQSSQTFDEVYSNPLDQQMVGVSVSIPLLDWGNSKGRKKMAQSQKEVVDIEVEQALLDFEQQVRLKVIDFNLQGKVVASAARADELAMQSFQVTKKRFMLGKVDVLRLTTAMKNRQMARERYINSLATYWRYFYEVQEITLYDFVNGVSIEEDFEILINR